MNPSALRELESIVGKEQVIIDEKSRAAAAENTLGVTRAVSAVVMPRTVDEVLRIVRTANIYGLKLYPISCGKNKGYGDMAPTSDGQVLVNLSRMNRIREYNPTEGYVVIEPGVTQAQLYHFIKEANDGWMIDATGAGPSSSILGNTLDGGFGHTPFGNKRKTVSGIEVVLGNGELFNAGTFPNMGPDANGLFVQANFGIVTAAQVKLMKMPQQYVSFRAVTETDAQLEPFIDTLRELREDGTLTSLVHVFDPVRMLVTVGVPKKYQGQEITAPFASRVLSEMYFEKHFWTAIGGLYGTKRQVAVKKKELSKRMKRIGVKVMYFTDRKISLIETVTHLGQRLGEKRFCAPVHTAMKGYRQLHGLMKGVPSDIAEKNIGVTIEEDNLGLFWISPTFSATGSDTRKVSSISSEMFKKHGFEAPFSVTLVEPHRAVGILNVRFNKKNQEEKERAYRLYSEIKERFATENIFTYRTSILDMDKLKVPRSESWGVFQLLKAALDPQGIIAPGRYGIAGEFIENAQASGE